MSSLQRDKQLNQALKAFCDRELPDEKDNKAKDAYFLVIHAQTITEVERKVRDVSSFVHGATGSMLLLDIANFFLKTGASRQEVAHAFARAAELLLVENLEEEAGSLDEEKSRRLLSEFVDIFMQGLANLLGIKGLVVLFTNGQGVGSSWRGTLSQSDAVELLLHLFAQYEALGYGHFLQARGRTR